MRRFHSGYESLIRVKEQAEQVVQLQQSAAKRQLEETTSSLRQLENQLALMAVSLEDRMGAQVQASHLLDHRDHIERLQSEIGRVRQSLTGIEAVFREATEKRISLTKEVETLRCAREAELREHRKTNEQSNQRTSDDHAVRRWIAS